MNKFFKDSLADKDSDIALAIQNELHRQQNQIELIASENIVSLAVLQAQGSVLTNKYAEGYSGRRYYGGCEFVDVAENLAIERAKKLFNCAFANVQPHSGSQANQAVMLALLKPGDKILGMSLAAGGHLTHGAAPNMSGKWFEAIQYGVKQSDSLIDFDQVEELAKLHKPKIIIAGGSAYPRAIDFARFKKIADEVGAYFWVDMAHFAGLVAAGEHINPLEYADVVTTTTHKTLRGPRGGMVLTNSEEIAKKVNSAMFPGLQGGPLMHVIAAKAVAFKEALSEDYVEYIVNVKKNAKMLAQVMLERGFGVITGGTDTHLILVDLSTKNITGNVAEKLLEQAGLTCNKNSIPFDKEKPMVTSGIRLGSPAGTTRGFKEQEFKQIGELIADVLDAIALNDQEKLDLVIANSLLRVRSLCKAFPIYKEL
jgi:glycine hydroxymethyltransferase